MYTVAELIETLKQCPQDYEVLLGFMTEIESVGIDHEKQTVNLFIE